MSDAKSPPDLSMDEILATIRRIIAEDDQPGAASTVGGGEAAAAGDAQLAPARRADDDVLELTEALNADGSVRHLAPIGSSSRAAAPVTPAEPAPEPPAEPNPVEAVATTAAAEPPPETAEQPPATLPAEPPPETAEAGPPAAAARTLEDIVCDLLRPMLQSWLDANLPPLVERLVQDEVARVSRAAGSA